jgi:transposase-like protein
MSKKTKKAYVWVLNFIKKLSPQFDPQVVVTDYEKALRAAIASVFPNARLVGCHFHYSQVCVIFSAVNNYLSDNIKLFLGPLEENQSCWPY